MKEHIKSILITFGLSSALVGCKSTPEVIKPVAYSNQYSYAYNLANQTALTRNDSPLRDFSEKEIIEARTSLEKYNGGSASVLFGAIKLLTLDLTGVIDIAGGNFATLANTRHVAGSPRWFVVIEKKNAGNAENAFQQARENIRNAQINAYSKYGKVTELTNESNGAKYLAVNIDGKEIPVGGVFKNNEDPLVIDGTFEGKESFMIGFDSKLSSSLISVSSPLLLSMNSSHKIDTDKVFSEISSVLPVGYYLYIPSFNKSYGIDGIYTNIKRIIPAIYTQGKKYEFIKPE